MQRIHIYIILLLILSGCNNATETKDTTTKKQEIKSSLSPKSMLDEEGTKKLVTVLTDYYSVKEGFMSTNSANIAKGSAVLMTTADSMRSYTKRTANAGMLTPYLDTLVIESGKMATAKTTKEQEIPFAKASDVLFAMLKKADLKNTVVYQQHCPMAFDDKGGNWLSNEEEIKNPYFPKKMPDCGDVADSLK
ncbi:MAG: DUF3347 domain-containing protein [Taibaiella sp.]|nr:DUF3347 domain-containing protein [Taibaiella sp.]